MNNRIVEIIVGASTGFNHPSESYSNFKPSLTLKATIEGTTAEVYRATKELQEAVHELLLEEKQRILAAIEHERKILRLEERIRGMLDRIENVRCNAAAFLEEASAIRDELDSGIVPSDGADDWRARKSVLLKEHEAGAALCAEHATEHEKELAVLREDLRKLRGLPSDAPAAT